MSQSGQFSLLKQRRFAPFFWTQFLGAFNDNVFKTAFLVVLTFDAVNWGIADPAMLATLIPGLFILPYVVFSATAGQIADRFTLAIGHQMTVRRNRPECGARITKSNSSR